MPEPTTIEELRDWLARRAGYGLPGDPAMLSDGRSVKLTKYARKETVEGFGTRIVFEDVHPIADTIDAAVRALPEGWGCWHQDDEWLSVKKLGTDDWVRVNATGHTPEAIRRDLLALARLAWIAEGAEP